LEDPSLLQFLVLDELHTYNGAQGTVGYSVKSKQGTQFRIGATLRLKEYIVKGFTLNDVRLKSGTSMNYFNEVQGCIREIRLSGKLFYQKNKGHLYH
jgi:hypothetical protein